MGIHSTGKSNQIPDIWVQNPKFKIQGYFTAEDAEARKGKQNRKLEIRGREHLL
jgi:hypothetical protein